MEGNNKSNRSNDFRSEYANLDNQVSSYRGSAYNVGKKLAFYNETKINNAINYLEIMGVDIERLPAWKRAEIFNKGIQQPNTKPKGTSQRNNPRKFPEGR